jgi:hypothetical protein
MGLGMEDVRSQVRAALAIYPPDVWSSEHCAAILSILDPDRSDARTLADAVFHAVHLAPNDGSGLDQHVIWECQAMMRNLSLRRDLTPQERMAFAVILAGANERKLSATGPGGPGLSEVFGVDLERPALRIVS